MTLALESLKQVSTLTLRDAQWLSACVCVNVCAVSYSVHSVMQCHRHAPHLFLTKLNFLLERSQQNTFDLCKAAEMEDTCKIYKRVEDGASMCVCVSAGNISINTSCLMWRLIGEEIKSSWMIYDQTVNTMTCRLK